jgi:2-oxo-3-hexenedioate decarboxylase
MFIAHAFDDAALSSVILMNALKRANVPSELHIFGAGGHGFGVRDSGLPLAHWRELCLNWLNWLGYADPAYTRKFVRDYRQAYAEGRAGLPRFSADAAHAGVDQAYLAQHRLVRAAIAAGDEITGYKGAFTSNAAQSANGVDSAQHGVLFKSGRLDAGATPTVVSVANNRPLLVETEIGYILAVDIGTKVLTPRQAMSAVEFLAPVIELPVNIGAVSDGKATAADLIAGNVGSSRYIVGTPVVPKSIGDTDKVAVTLTLDGQELHRSTGAEVKDGQAQNLMILLNQILDQGQVLHKGDLIICGALGGAKPGQKGAYRADYGPLGKIEFKLE